mmetsp:Transcript_165608/g.531554  ORF Transcript_165608/g.531554 Transcript_165608/m.531554 type:complete len:326 (+) Transcript_165608:738-1715(+)
MRRYPATKARGTSPAAEERGLRQCVAPPPRRPLSCQLQGRRPSRRCSWCGATTPATPGRPPHPDRLQGPTCQQAPTAPSPCHTLPMSVATAPTTVPSPPPTTTRHPRRCPAAKQKAAKARRRMLGGWPRRQGSCDRPVPSPALALRPSVPTPPAWRRALQEASADGLAPRARGPTPVRRCPAYPEGQHARPPTTCHAPRKSPASRRVARTRPTRGLRWLLGRSSAAVPSCTAATTTCRRRRNQRWAARMPIVGARPAVPRGRRPWWRRSACRRRARRRGHRPRAGHRHRHGRHQRQSPLRRRRPHAQRLRRPPGRSGRPVRTPPG